MIEFNYFLKGKLTLSGNMDNFDEIIGIRSVIVDNFEIVFVCKVKCWLSQTNNDFGIDWLKSGACDGYWFCQSKDVKTYFLVSLNIVKK